jgi:Protein of unknown function (DUF1579)
MNGRVVGMVLACTALIGLVAGRGPAADKKEKKEASYEAMMAKYGAPGPEHKTLEPLVGTWNTTIKFWMAPGQGPLESQGTVKRKWILGNRFVEEHYDGKAFDKPFKGLGLMGYDRFKKKYLSVWLDSMSTAIMTTQGTYEAANKTFTFTGEENDAFTGGVLKTRDVLKIVDQNKHVFEMYRQGKQGPEYKMMEISCTRKEK